MLTRPEPTKDVIAYYRKHESQFGYRLVLRGRKHFGYYPEDGRRLSMHGAQRLMEDRVGIALDLPAGSLVLDAGCGEGHTAIRLASRFGLRVEGVDLLDFNISRGRRLARRRGLAGSVRLHEGDYSRSPFADDTFDGVYTLESLVHAPDHDLALLEFRRVLRPGGKVVLFEYSMPAQRDLTPSARATFATINEGSAMFSFPRFENGRFPEILGAAGFVDIEVTDISYRIEPMLRHMARLCWLPYRAAQMFGLERRYVNVMAAVEYYRLRELMHYNIVTGIKPGAPG